MKKLILTAFILASLTTMRATAQCYWSTQLSWGFDGYGVYSGKACFTDDGLQQKSFTPLIPILTVG